MSVSCDCDVDYYPDPGDTCWYWPDDYSTLDTSKRKRCCSCNTLIDVGSIVGEFPRYKVPENEIEERIYGEDGEIPRASHYMCESCTDIYFSITDLGYCITGMNMPQALKDYHALKRDEAAWKEKFS